MSVSQADQYLIIIGRLDGALGLNNADPPVRQHGLPFATD
jgi:hypothetical protein